MIAWYRALGLVIVTALPAVAWGAPHYQPSAEAQLCLECHAYENTLTLGNGKEVEVQMHPAQLAASVHRDLSCTDCHPGLSPDGHDERSFKNLRDFKVRHAEVCTKCHDASSGLHGKMLQAIGGLICTDCHGSHTVKPIAADAGCTSCHAYKLQEKLGDGTEATLSIHPEDLKKSVHADLDCTDCHAGYSRKAHPAHTFASRRDMTLQLSRGCKQCHFDKYTRTLESIHYKMLEKGNLKAPVCVDCHGSHGIQSGRHHRIVYAQRCAKCHRDVYETYLGSVHGRALVEDNNQDVPVCSDCHTAHQISDPRTEDFRNRTPQMCGNCHANEKMMTKYGLSTDVLSTYLDDFHGVTATFYRKNGGGEQRIAVCTDCHGIHDIMPTKGPRSMVVKAKLLARCRSCHPDATQSFPDAWMPHYEASLRRAPLVFLVRWGYRLLIPFIVCGLVLQILLHVWRYTVHR